MDDREIANLVNELTDIALKFSSTQQLRQNISNHLVCKLKQDQIEINNGSDWFNEYQKVDDFLLGKLSFNFPIEGNSAYINTIKAIELLIEK